MKTVAVGNSNIPAIGLGTIWLRDEPCVRAVVEALRLGYRHLDTAAGYLNEREIGEGLRASGLSRNAVFVTTKVPPTELAPGRFERCVEASLKNLGLLWVDQLLIHWPSAEVPLPVSIALLCNAKRNGYARHVGVANFPVTMIEQAVELATEPLSTNQIEVHPFIDQRKVIDVCGNHGIAVTAYAPLARGKALDHPDLNAIAARHGKTAAQVMIRYAIEQDFIAIPRSANPKHLKENFEVFDFMLDAHDMAGLTALNATRMRVINPAYAPQWDD
jgi:2,5-diketo-D-gluconate reductase B